MKTLCFLLVIGAATIGLAPPANSSTVDYTSVEGTKNSSLKAEASPTPAPGPVAKSNPGTHKAKPTPSPVPLKLVMPTATVKKP